MKKLLCILMSALLAGALCGCGNVSDGKGDGNTNKPPEPQPPAQDLTAFRTVYEDNETKQMAAGGEVTFAVSAALTKENYFALDFKSESVVRGRILYTDSFGVETFEEFYSLAGTQSLRQIVDFFSLADGNKTVTGIRFYNLGATAANVTLKKVQVAAHPIDFSGVLFDRPQEVEERMQLFLTGEHVKLGITLKSGGCINWLSSCDGTVAESVRDDGTVFVGKHADAKGEVVVSDDVNLINTYDNGRFVQQSYYGVKSGEDGYTGGTFGADGENARPWPYNPVQGGDCKNNCSQLVDVQVSETEIYIKTRPMDWARKGRVTQAYMENTYTLCKNETYGEYITVENRFTDFSGYNHNNVRAQELPAFYGISPLGSAVYYAGSDPFTGGTLTRNDSMEFWDGNPAARLRCTENWIGWVNEEDWGVALYVPKVVSVLAGRASHSVAYSDLKNTPYKSASTTYAAPLGYFSLVTYETFEYAYYLTLNTVNDARALFGGLDTQNVNNFLADKAVW